MFDTTKALVLREVRYKEADRILTLISADHGKLSAKARGALRRGSKTAAATQQLTYSELTLFFNKGKWTVNEGVVLEAFDGLRADICALALGCYIAECLDALSVEDQPDAPLMQLGLNSLYALSRGMYSHAQIKAAFELRLMCLAGYTPELGGCAVCGAKEPEEPVLPPVPHSSVRQNCRAVSGVACGHAVYYFRPGQAVVFLHPWQRGACPPRQRGGGLSSLPDRTALFHAGLL